MSTPDMRLYQRGCRLVASLMIPVSSVLDLPGDVAPLWHSAPGPLAREAAWSSRPRVTQLWSGPSQDRATGLKRTRAFSCACFQTFELHCFPLNGVNFAHKERSKEKGLYELNSLRSLKFSAWAVS